MLVLVLWSVIDGHGNEIPVTKVENIGVISKELIHLAAVGAPVASNVQQNAPAGSLRLDNAGLNVGPSVSCRIVFVNGDITSCRF
jgi:hypothetical protein